MSNTTDRDRRNDTLVIIPAYNEEANLAGIIGQIRSALPAADVLVVNDGSQDDTARVAVESGARILELPFNMGYGVALQTGYKYALRNGYHFAAQIDGDGQHEPEDIPLLLAVVRRGEADLALGSRFLSRKKYNAPLFRRMGMILFRLVTSFLVRQRITDPTSGCQALNQKTIQLYASHVFPVDYPDADVLLMARRTGLKIKEVSVRMYQAADNRSMHSGIKPLYYIFKMFLSIAVTLLRKHELPLTEDESLSESPNRQKGRSKP